MTRYLCIFALLLSGVVTEAATPGFRYRYAQPPLASDSFTRPNGAMGTTDGMGIAPHTGAGRIWNGVTWGILNNAATNNPGTNGELFANNTLSADTDWQKQTGWTIGGGVATKTAGTASKLYQSVCSLEGWYLGTWTLVSRSAGTAGLVIGGDSPFSTALTGTYHTTGRKGAFTSGGVIGNSGFAGSVDDLYLSYFVQSSLVAIVTNLPTANMSVSASFRRGSPLFQAGVVANYDAATGTNSLYAYYDGNSAAHLDSCVNGNYTNYITGSITYSDGAPIAIISRPSVGTVELIYNGVSVGVKTSGVWPGFSAFTSSGLFATSTNAAFTNFFALPQ